MSSPESFPQKPLHDSTAEHAAEAAVSSEFDAERERQKGFIESGKTKYEGIILYAPLSPEVKQEILTKLEEVQLPQGALADTFTSQMAGMRDEEKGFLWVDRQMRGFLESRFQEIGKENFRMLQLSLDNQTVTPGDQWKIRAENGEWQVIPETDNERKGN